jgi:hypothetical protein
LALFAFIHALDLFTYILTFARDFYVRRLGDFGVLKSITALAHSILRHNFVHFRSTALGHSQCSIDVVAINRPAVAGNGSVREGDRRAAFVCSTINLGILGIIPHSGAIDFDSSRAPR